MIIKPDHEFEERLVKCQIGGVRNKLEFVDFKIALTAQIANGRFRIRTIKSGESICFCPSVKAFHQPSLNL